MGAVSSSMAGRRSLMKAGMSFSWREMEDHDLLLCYAREG